MQKYDNEPEFSFRSPACTPGLRGPRQARVARRPNRRRGCPRAARMRYASGRSRQRSRGRETYVHARSPRVPTATREVAMTSCKALARVVLPAAFLWLLAGWPPPASAAAMHTPPSTHTHIYKVQRHSCRWHPNSDACMGPQRHGRAHQHHRASMHGRA